MSKSLDLEEQYLFYLKKMNLKESEMHELQKQETKRAFYGGIACLLNLTMNVIFKIDDEDRAVVSLDDVWNQTKVYWEKEVSKSINQN